jgi:hypothetical protein
LTNHLAVSCRSFFAVIHKVKKKTFWPIVQSVGGATSYSEGSIIMPGEAENNRLVFIGREIDVERIVHELSQYLTE